MLTCPRCRKKLARTKSQRGGLLYVCSQCSGRGLGLAVVRRAVGKQKVAELWRAAARAQNDSKPSRGAGCPGCSRPMYEIPVVGRPKRVVHVDVCRACQFVWFDADELESLPQAIPPKPKSAVKEPQSLAAREQAALARLRVEDYRRRGTDLGGEPPDESWKMLPALLGMPVEHEVNPVRCWPWATWAMAASLVLVFLFTVFDLRPAIEQWGLIPAQAMRHGGLTFITSFFLHGGVMHLVGNVYFLVVFGDNVEDRVGTMRYLLLVVLAALIGDLAHIATDPQSPIPAVGASGGISGIIAFYALRFPRARIGLLFRYWYVFRWMYMPAYVAFFLWGLLQILLAYQQLAGVGSVAAFAHLGGAAAGVVAWATWRDI